MILTNMKIIIIIFNEYDDKNKNNNNNNNDNDPSFIINGNRVSGNTKKVTNNKIFKCYL